MVGAFADLAQRKGYAATGLNDVVAASGAPKGSLYHHFPGGKEQLAVQAVEAAAAAVEAAIEGLLAAHPPAIAIKRLAAAQAAGLEQTGFERGCPLATLALETGHSHDALAAATAGGFGAWHGHIAAALRRHGFSPSAARDRATLVLSALEGALVLARVQRDTTPLRVVARQLAPLLEKGTT